MTAEIAIANGTGVALAADSAVTIGGKKIYNSAIKLFSLSKVEPVGIMIYGNANLLDVPWETIIKTCREELGGSKFPHLEEYGTFLLDFIRKNGHFFSDESQKKWILSNAFSYFSSIQNELEERVKEHFRTAGNVSSLQSKEYFQETVKKYHAELKPLALCGDFTEDSEKALREKYKKEIRQVIDEIFQNLEIHPSYISKLNDIATFIHTRAIFPPDISGVVIAGFGDDEIFPVIKTYEMAGVVDTKLKYKVNTQKCRALTNGNNCTIIPFAQDDMVASFMNGVNPVLIDIIHRYISKTFEELPKLLSDELLNGSQTPAEEIRSHIGRSSTSLHDGLQELINDVIQKHHVSPVLNMVTALPKDELAAMAESLVNLTAFKRRMTESLETVGGPIDVVVISKGDGLVWVRRKHYFPRELNHSFFSNYFRGLGHD